MIGGGFGFGPTAHLKMEMKMELTIRAMVSHVNALARAFNVRLILDYRLPREKACAIPESRTVFARPITDTTGYAVVLHEMGHLCSPTGHMLFVLREPSVEQAISVSQLLRSIRLQMDQEDAAWDWARHYALNWTTEMEHVRQMSTETYRQQLADAERLLNP